MNKQQNPCLREVPGKLIVIRRHKTMSVRASDWHSTVHYLVPFLHDQSLTGSLVSLPFSGIHYIQKQRPIFKAVSCSGTLHCSH